METISKIVKTSGMSLVEKLPYYSDPYGKIGLLSFDFEISFLDLATLLSSYESYKRKWIIQFDTRLKLPNAKRFKRWVTSKVLPSIRKPGMYATEELLNNPDLLIKVAIKLKN